MPRQLHESTAFYLGRTLDNLGLHDMARRARLGHFDDYFCPPEVDDGANINRLVIELRKQRNVQIDRRLAGRINVMIDDAINGEFDGTKEESDEWAKSPMGRKRLGCCLKENDAYN
jgi:hypothetical protein